MTILSPTSAGEPLAVSLEEDHFGVVDEAVNHVGDHVVAEHLAPPADDLVAGDDQARPLLDETSWKNKFAASASNGM